MLVGMPDRPLYVRLPEREADLLDRAAGDAGVSKRQMVTELVQRQLTVGRLELRPPEAEVLTAEQLAALLQTTVDAVAELADAGGLPGRRVGGEWRFSRAAVLDWLGQRST
jgi:excisionase family DNA binding protein